MITYSPKVEMQRAKKELYKVILEEKSTEGHSILSRCPDEASKREFLTSLFNESFVPEYKKALLRVYRPKSVKHILDGLQEEFYKMGSEML